MKKILYLLIGISALSCINNVDSRKKADLVINSEIKSIEIKYADSRKKTIESLKKIWNCESPMISKSETNFNGKISNDISLMIAEFKPIDSKKKDSNIKLTSELIKKSVLNYLEFSELKIITSYTADGERRTSSRTIKMTEL